MALFSPPLALWQVSNAATLYALKHGSMYDGYPCDGAKGREYGVMNYGDAESHMAI